MNRLSAPPGAKRLIDSLRGLGYECSTAIADLIDNSITAGSTEVHVEVSAEDGSTPAFILISDNGKGMDRDELHQAMRFGAFQEYSENDLGKYGLGLKTASLSQCRRLVVLSKPKVRAGKRSRVSVMAWDLDEIHKKDTWDLLNYDFEELKGWQRTILEKYLPSESGTVILWSNFDSDLKSLTSERGKDLQTFCAKLLEATELHLRTVFHRFLEGKAAKRPKLNILLNGNKIKFWDPFCLSEDGTNSLNPKNYSISVVDEDGKKSNQKVTLYPYILPTEDRFSSREKHRDAAGEKGWNFQQGFYFYRNGRLLQSGGWSYLRRPDEHTKLIRIAVEFPMHLDKVFGINVTKMRAKIPPQVMAEIERDVSNWTKKARNIYDKVTLGGSNGKSGHSKKSQKELPKVAQASTPAQRIAGINFTVSNVSGGGLTISNDKSKIIVPFTHDLRPLLDKKLGREPEFKNLCVLMFSLLELVKTKKLEPSAIPLDKIKSDLARLI